MAALGRGWALVSPFDEVRQQAIYSVQPAHAPHPGAQAGDGYNGYGSGYGDGYGDGYDGCGDGYCGGYTGSAQASPDGGQQRVASGLVVSYEDDEVIEYANTEAHGRGRHHHGGTVTLEGCSARGKIKGRQCQVGGVGDGQAGCG
jgi:hypothetical protein